MFEDGTIPVPVARVPCVECARTHPKVACLSRTDPSDDILKSDMCLLKKSVSDGEICRAVGTLSSGSVKGC